MNQIMPLHYIKSNISSSIVINKIKQCHRHSIANSGSTVTYYSAITNYGQLTLVIQNYQQKIDGQNSVQFINRRTQLMRKYCNCFPIVYEQNICVNHPQQICCITIISKCNIFEQENYNQGEFNHDKKWTVRSIEKLVRCLNTMEQQGFGYHGSLNLKQLVYYQYQDSLNIDFTRIKPVSNQKQSNIVQSCATIINKILTFQSKQEHKSIILLQQKLYQLQPSLLNKAQDLTQLMLYLNIFPISDIEVYYEAVSPMKQGKQKSKYRKIVMQQLQGKQKIKANNKIYQNLQFIQGKCTNCLSQIAQPKLSQLTTMLKSGTTSIKIHKHEHIYLTICPTNINNFSLNIGQSQADCTITVHESVQKIDFISFIISYLKIVAPLIHQVSFVKENNTINIRYRLSNTRLSRNRSGIFQDTDQGQSKDKNKYIRRDSQKQKQKENQRVTMIVFPKGYIVKDQQISMIIQRSKLKNCKLDVRYMKINDTLPMFLANSQKTSKLSEIYMSDCHGISDVGINMLVHSPFCRKLNTLGLVLDDAAFASSIQSLGLKTDLKRLSLQLNANTNDDAKKQSKTQLRLSTIKMQELTSKGLKISLSSLNLSNLRIVQIDQIVLVEQLKYLAKAHLIELKIRLQQSAKKNIIQSTSSLVGGLITNRNNPVRTFAQGPSQHTLRLLDISQSNVKLKSIKPLLCMPQLQHICVQYCTNIGTDLQPLPPKLLHLSLKSTVISIANLDHLLHKIPMMINLNISGSNDNISKVQLVNFINGRNKFINNLIISDRLYSSKLLQPKTMGNKDKNSMSMSNYQLIQNLNIDVSNLVIDKKQQQIYTILMDVIKTPKIVNFIVKLDQLKAKLNDNCDNGQSNIIRMVRRFVKLMDKHDGQLKNLKINNIPYVQMCNQSVEQDTIVKLNWSMQSNNNLIQLNIDQNCTISELLHMVHYYKSTLSQKQLMKKSTSILINLNNNHILPASSIQLIQQHIGNYVTALQFQNCALISIKDKLVIQNLFMLQRLDSINGGNCFIRIDGHTGHYMDKYLKFCMKLRQIKSLQVQVQGVQDTQILYSVLYHIFDKHQQTLTSITITFTSQQICIDSDLFFSKLFQLPLLKSLTLRLIQCSLTHKLTASMSQKLKPLKQKSMLICLQDISRLQNKLEELVLEMPSIWIPAPLTMHKLKKLYIKFNEGYENQWQDDNVNQHGDFNKIMKNINLSSITQFSLDISLCQHITSATRLFSYGPNLSMIDRMQYLQRISLSFQYCPLKQSSVYQLMCQMCNLPKIQQIFLNISFINSISNNNNNNNSTSPVVNQSELLYRINQLLNTIVREIKVTIVAVLNSANGSNGNNGNSSAIKTISRMDSNNRVEFIV